MVTDLTAAALPARATADTGNNTSQARDQWLLACRSNFGGGGMQEWSCAISKNLIACRRSLQDAHLLKRPRLVSGVCPAGVMGSYCTVRTCASAQLYGIPPGPRPILP